MYKKWSMGDVPFVAVFSGQTEIGAPHDAFAPTTCPRTWAGAGSMQSAQQVLTSIFTGSFRS